MHIASVGMTLDRRIIYLARANVRGGEVQLRYHVAEVLGGVFSLP